MDREELNNEQSCSNCFFQSALICWCKVSGLYGVEITKNYKCIYWEYDPKY